MTMASQQRATCLAVALLSLSDCVECFPINRGIQPSSLTHRRTPSSSLHAKAIEVSETDVQIAERILEEVDTGLRNYDAQTDIDISGYGDPDEYLAMEDDDDGAIDSATLGQFSAADYEDKFEYEWDPDAGDTDPNIPDPNYEYVKDIPLDAEGMQVGYDPMFGPSNPIDERTIMNPPDSYVIDEKTRDDQLVTKDFPDGDPEQKANSDFVAFRKSLNQVETYTDPFLKQEVPRHTAKWHGYPEQLSYPKQDYMNNRFTKEEDRTDFDALGPARARKVAVQMARAKNNEWLPEGLSQDYHEGKIAIYKKMGILTGSTLPGNIDAETAAKIQPALDVLGDVAELLSIEVDTVFRFKYHGLIKNKRGMKAWTEKLIRNCDVDCTGVVFETGFRKRDPWYDGGDHWHGPY